MSRAKPPKRSRTAPARLVAIEADYSRGLFSEVDAALTKWLLAHGQAVDHSAWNKTQQERIEYLPE